MTNDLERVVKLAELLKEQSEEVKDLTARLAEAKGNMLRTEREDLPTLMAEIGLEELVLKGGTVIKITEDCTASITDATRVQALDWLINNGFGGLVKTEVAVEFARGDRDAAQTLARRLAEDVEGVQCKEIVHPSTLKAFVKEQLREGRPIPMDLFNVYPYSKAVLK